MTIHRVDTLLNSYNHLKYSGNPKGKGVLASCCSVVRVDNEEKTIHRCGRDTFEITWRGEQQPW